MNSTIRTRGGVVAIVLPSVLALAGAGALLAGHLSSTAETSSSRARANYRVTREGARKWLLRAGLDPKALCAAGFSGNVTTVVVNLASNYLTQSGFDLEQAEANKRRTQAQVTTLERRVTGGLSNAEERQSLATARADLASATTEEETLLSNMVSFCTGMVDAQVAGRVRAISHNRQFSVPLEYAVENRTEAQWIRLRDAVSAKHIAQREGRPVSGAVQAVIDEATTQAVRDAAGNLSNSAADITQSWELAVNAIGGG